MAASLLGAHMPTSGGLGAAIRNGKAIGCEAVQVFTSSPQQWKSREVTDEMVDDFRRARHKTGINVVVSHDSYLVNLSSTDPELREKSFRGLAAEMERCSRYGIGWVVSHMGSGKGWGPGEAILGLIEATGRLLSETPPDVTLLMETTAGQGAALNSRFEEIAQILDALGNPDRLAVYLDTCHIFAAGYDLRTKETYEATFSEFDRLVGISKLKAIHCNDSQKALGSRVDRHAHIGEGEIGPEAFRLLVNDSRFDGLPILLETPEAPEGHERNLKTLRSYRR